MQFPFVIAHGGLGNFDELIFVGIGIVFLALMAFSWIRSRNVEPVLEDEPNVKTSTHDTATSPDADDRFHLE